MKWTTLDNLERVSSVQTTDGRVFAAMHKIPNTENYVVSFVMVNNKGEIDVIKQSTDWYAQALVRFSVCENMCKQWQALLDKRRVYERAK